jgi:hypothetical protein
MSQIAAATNWSLGMPLLGKEPVLADVVSISIECADCGRTRWRRLPELRRLGISENTRLTDLSTRLFCTACREEGLHGKHIMVQAAFATDLKRERADAFRLNIREVHGRGLRAIGA